MRNTRVFLIEARVVADKGLQDAALDIPHALYTIQWVPKAPVLSMPSTQLRTQSSKPRIHS
jgi:hypothetical protein